FQMALERGHAQRRAPQEEAGEPIALEAAARAAPHPLAELGTVAHQLAEIVSVPRGNVSLERAGIGPRQTAARSVAAGASERFGPLATTRGERIVGLGHAGDRRHVLDQILDPSLAQPLLEGRHAERAPIPLRAPGL